MINFYDFEVFKYDWLVVIINPFTKEIIKIHNDTDKLKKYYEKHSNDIWCGFNSRHYDQYIFKGLLLDFDAYDISEHIITKDKPGWSYSSLFNEIFLINYDVQPLNSSLKQLEGFQGHNIHESGVDFRIKRKLTPAEVNETFGYCQNDVEECINVWLQNKSDFDAQMGLIKMFKLPFAAMSKTKAQISAEILECEKMNFNDEWDLKILDCLRLKKYTHVKEWFLNKANHDYKNSLTVDVCGVPHIFGWGGIHGAKEKYHYKCDNDYLILHVDVASYYPSLMIFHNLLTRASRKPERFKEIYDLRLKLKREGKKKEQAPLKIVLNGTFGICKDKNNKAYDPRTANSICINGQLLLLDLLEKLESIPTFELIQSNTDGLIIKIHRRYFEAVDDVCYEWESRSKMQLEFDYIKEIYQKDVNNYVFVQFDGKVERKGAYVKELSPIDNDLPIINKALVDYMLKGVPPEITINNCNSLIEFQKICKLTSKFNGVIHNGKKYYNKCYRIFASSRMTDGAVQKYKIVTKKAHSKKDRIYVREPIVEKRLNNICALSNGYGWCINPKSKYNHKRCPFEFEKLHKCNEYVEDWFEVVIDEGDYITEYPQYNYFKFANTSDNSFIENGDVTTAKVPAHLDRQFYINMAYERLEQYGIDVNTQMRLKI